MSRENPIYITDGESHMEPGIGASASDILEITPLPLPSTPPEPSNTGESVISIDLGTTQIAMVEISPGFQIMDWKLITLHFPKSSTHRHEQKRSCGHRTIATKSCLGTCGCNKKVMLSIVG